MTDSNNLKRENRIMKCKDCAYWSQTTNLRALPNIVGDCSNQKFVTGYSMKLKSSDEVLIENDEGWGFFTGPDFGCIHFEKKVL